MNRRRLDAEALRDAILLVSGQLDRTVHGPAIRKGTIIERDNPFDDVRRSVYTPVFRNRLLDLFEVFDFPDPNIVVGRRNLSTVPTQALYLLNSPFAMAQSRHVAQNLMKLPGITDAERIDLPYRKALGRLPTERARQLALAYLTDAVLDQRLAEWERFCQTLFASLDFRHVN